jgi:hypothetical protein
MIGMGRRLVCAWFLSSLAISQTLPDGASELAKRILRTLKPRDGATYSLEVTAAAGAIPDDELRARLESAGLKRGLSPAESDVRITLAENVRGYVWVAETGRGADRQVVLLEWPRAESAAQSDAGLRLRLKREPVWEQDDPILDWTLLRDRSALLVLETERLALYRREGAGWAAAESAPVPTVKTRDPRGRIALVAGTGGFTVYLPAGVCTGLVETSLKLDCRATAVAWPLEAGGRQLADAEFAGGRNFFDGRVSVGQTERILPPFFSFAAIQSSGNPVWIFAGVDGQTRLYTPQLEAAGAIADFGSDIVPVTTTCGDGWQVLATATGDGMEADSVRAYRIAGGRAVAASAPVEFPGPVTALWPSADGKSAHAVVREMKTGRYAALRLDITCPE